MSDVAEMLAWLRREIEADKTAAHDAGGDRWHIGNAVDPTRPCSIHTFPSVRIVAKECGWLHAEHIIGHDPQGAIADCDAKLAILSEFERAVQRGDAALQAEQAHYPEPPLAMIRANNVRFEVRQAWTQAVRHLAHGYRHRNGYQEEWRP